MPFIDTLRRLWRARRGTTGSTGNSGGNSTSSTLGPSPSAAPIRTLGRAAMGAAVVAAAGCAQAPPVVRDPAEEAAKLAWQAYRRNAAERIMAAAPAGTTYRHLPPEPLLGIPVLQVWLAADGSVARIEVLREPHVAKHVTALAIAAVQRAAPFGSVAHLPRPWTFAETFLFDDEQRFMPASLNDF